MNTNLPDWHRLVSGWLARGRYGLTIPFLVGARATRANIEVNGATSIRSLLGEIIRQPVHGYVVYPRWCDDMAAVVLATYQTDFPYRPRHNLIEFRPTADAPLSMAAEASLAKKLGVEAAPSALLAALVEHALPYVEQGNFSRFWTEEGRQYGPLQHDDLTFIAEALDGDAA
ncbi:MAG: hypothetical protein KF796_02870 [Ramlibacter sp.]|nr:hypothetical protein [Ramlibacter sp.]